MRLRHSASALIAAVGIAACSAAPPAQTAARAATPARHSPATVTRPASPVAAPRRSPRSRIAPAAPAPAARPVGNPAGGAAVPPAGRPVSTAHPASVIGDGTPASCTSRAVVAAVARGGVITFSCGPGAVTIAMTATAKVRNTSRRVVLDGGGKVTLSGGGVRRILYQDTCDPAQGWTTSHCQDQPTPKLTVQNIGFADGNSTGQAYDGGGGGAIFDRGGQLRVVNSWFTHNRCDPTGPDLGGAAIRALSQYRPVYVVDSTFTAGVCSNGGALSSIGVSWVVLNSVMTGNRAIGYGANPARAGTPGGGSGAGVYTDGDAYTVTVGGCVIARNHANEGGGAIFFVSDNRTGTLAIERSTLRRNVSAGFFSPGYPGVFFLGAGQPDVAGSVLR